MNHLKKTSRPSKALEVVKTVVVASCVLAAYGAVVVGVWITGQPEKS